MAWNYKRGRDLNTNLALAGHYFVDVVNGSNTTGNGTITNPWQTIAHANTNGALVLNAGTYLVPSLTGLTSKVIVLARGEYLNDLNNMTTSSNVVLLGDSLNYDVVIKSSILPKVQLTSNTSNVSIFNILIKGYINTTGNFRASNNCIFEECDNFRYLGSANNKNNCWLNSTVKLGVGSNSGVSSAEATNESFYGCQVEQAMFVLTTNNCFFDSLTQLTKDPIVTNFNFVHNKPYFENKGNCFALVTGGSNVVNNEITGNPRWKYALATLDSNGNPIQASFDFSLIDKLSSLFTQNIGWKYYKGISFNVSDSGFNALILSKPELEIVNGNIRFKSTVPSGTVVEIGENGELPFNAPIKSTLTSPFQIGLGYNPELAFEVRTKFYSTDPSFSPWKKYRLGEQMTLNPDGTSTGEDTYDWRFNEQVNYQQAQGKIVMTKA